MGYPRKLRDNLGEYGILQIRRICGYDSIADSTFCFWLCTVGCPLFSGTYSFLPQRHGIVPNTLHVILHVSTVALLAVLAVVTL